MIEISWPLLITQVVTFLAAMVVIWRLFWGPLTRTMKERTEKISSDLERAESGRREIEALEADYRRRMSAIEEQARKEIKDAVQKGNLAKEEILATARQEAQRILEKAQQDLAREREQVIRELRSQVADLSLSAVERLIGNGVDQKAQRRLLEEFIGEVEKLAPPSSPERRAS
ncbi:MAG: F0F1 ATP synthase subunit B [candidate division FCPU426 bacterium]